ncbi:DUF4255 domain-containing protein [[Clostridium] innocuum]|nr:DUF4255 domain-containing protein [[Clostridium] innocuum]
MIHEVSKTLCAQLIDQLYPDYLLDRDGVQLCIPRHEHQDVQIGIYLYDISEYSITAQRYASVDGDSRVFPPKLMELSYLIYVNEDARFGGYNKEQEEILYEKMIQIFHDLSVLQVKDRQLPLQFVNMELDSKIHIWESLHQPLQPALYLRVAPVEIASMKNEKVNIVRHVDGKTKSKHKGGV